MFVWTSVRETVCSWQERWPVQLFGVFWLEREGLVIWSRLVAGFWSRLVAGSGLVACRRSVREPDAALHTRCLQRHRVAGSSPADLGRRRPHEAGRSEIALVPSSPVLELEAFNKYR